MVFLYHLFLFLKEAELANFVDDKHNTDLTKLLVTLQKECEIAVYGHDSSEKVLLISSERNLYYKLVF